MMTLAKPAGKPFTILVKNLDGWWSAVCPELCVSGFGKNKTAAIESVARAMRSTLLAQAHSIREGKRNLNLNTIAQVERVAA